MSVTIQDLPPANARKPFVAADFMEQADGDQRIANRLLFLADIDVALLTDPENQGLQELGQMVRDDLAYFMVAKSVGRVAY